VSLSSALPQDVRDPDYNRHAQLYLHGATVGVSAALHLVVAVISAFVYTKTRDNIPAWIVTASDTSKQSTDGRHASTDVSLDLTRRFQYVAVFSCLCRAGLGLLTWMTSRAHFLSDQAQVALYLVAMAMTSTLQPALYLYGMLQHRRRRERKERLFKILLARRRVMPPTRQ
jgi:hypothetical protein